MGSGTYSCTCCTFITRRGTTGVVCTKTPFEASWSCKGEQPLGLVSVSLCNSLGMRSPQHNYGCSCPPENLGPHCWPDLVVQPHDCIQLAEELWMMMHSLHQHDLIMHADAPVQVPADRLVTA